MRNSKLIDLFSVLTKTELREFGNYLKAFSQKEKKKEFKLYELLKQYYPEFPEKKIEKSVLMKKIFPEVDSKDTKKITDLMSNLSIILDEFLVLTTIRNNKLEMDKQLLKVYQERKLDKLFLKKHDQVSKRIKKLPNRDNEYHYELYLLNIAAYGHPFRDVLFSDKLVNGLFEEMNGHLDEHYFISKLILYLEKLNRSKYRDFYTKEDFSVVIASYTQENELLTNPIYELIQILIEAFKNDDYSNYPKLKETFIKNIHLLNPLNRMAFYSLSMNYCNRAYNYEKVKLSEMLSLYKLGVNENLLTINGYFPQFVFNNIISIGCQLQDFNWISNFIKDHEHKLNEKVKSDNIALAWSFFHFYKKDFQKTLDYVNQIEFNDEQYKVKGKSLQIRSFYELKEFLAIESLCIAVKQSLRRSKVFSEAFKLNYHNFIIFTQKLVKARLEVNIDLKSKAEALEMDLNQCKNCFFKEWLLEKITEFK